MSVTSTNGGNDLRSRNSCKIYGAGLVHAIACHYRYKLCVTLKKGEKHEIQKSNENF